MPAGYDGSEFVGIDEECIEPNGAAARFWSTYFDNALASNIQYVAELGHEVAWAPLTNNGGDYNNKEGVRPYTSLNRTSVFVVPWIFAEDVTQLQLGLIARVADEPGDGQGVGVALQRRTADLATIVRSSPTASLGSTVGDPVEFGAHKILLPTGEQVSDAVGAVAFWVTGAAPFNDLAVTLGGGSQRTSTIYKADDTDFYLDGSLSGRPDADSLDLQYTRLTVVGVDAEHVFYPQGLGSADGEVIGTLGPTRPVPNQLARRALSYLQIKGATLWQTFTDATRPDAQAYAAQRAIVGEVAVTHALRTDAVYTRPRPVWMGPVGYLPDPEASEWPAGYHYRFGRVYGDSASTQRLMSASLALETVNPIVRVMAYVAPLHVFPVTQPEGADLAALTPQIEWEHTLELKQLADGDASWADATAIGDVDAVVRHAHRPYEEGSLLCVTEAAIRYPFSGDPAGQGYAYREGQLSEEDLSRLELVSFDIQTTYDPTTDRPMLLTWDVLTLNPIEEDWGNVGDKPNPFFPDTERARDLDTLGFLLVGVTIWEVPR
jgi:hypothetical protein